MIGAVEVTGVRAKTTGGWMVTAHTPTATANNHSSSGSQALRTAKGINLQRAMLKDTRKAYAGYAQGTLEGVP